MKDKISTVMDDVVTKHILNRQKAVVRGKTRRDNLRYVRQVRPTTHPRSAESFGAESKDYKKAYDRLKGALYDEWKYRDIEDSCNCEYNIDKKLESGEITMEEAESDTPQCQYCEVMDVFDEYGAESFEADCDDFYNLPTKIKRNAVKMAYRQYDKNYDTVSSVKLENAEGLIDKYENKGLTHGMAWEQAMKEGGLWNVLMDGVNICAIRYGNADFYDENNDQYNLHLIEGDFNAESFGAETKFVKSLSNKDIDRIFRYLWDNSQMTAEYWFKKSSDAEKKKIYKITQDDMDAETFEAPKKYRGSRPSPSTSATSVNVGTKIRGGNGKLWVCKTYPRGNKRVKRWVLAAEDDDWEIDDRDIYNPDRAAIDAIRGNRALREQMEDQGIHIGRHPGHYDDSGHWVEKEGYHHEGGVNPAPLWVQFGIVLGVLTGFTVAAKKGWLNFGYEEPLPDQNETENDKEV